MISGDGYATTDEDIMDNVSNMSRESARDEILHGWQSPKSKKKTRQVVVAPRVSRRIPRDGIPIAENDSMRAQAKNYIIGTINTSNPFTLLSNTPSEELHKVLCDINIVVEEVGEQIGAFKVEEVARVALAEANYKVYLEKLRERDKHREDFPEDISMGVIDNSTRLNVADSSKHDLTKGVMEHVEGVFDKVPTKVVLEQNGENVVAVNPKGGVIVPLSQNI